MYSVFISKEAEHALKTVPNSHRTRINNLVESLSVAFFPKHFDIVKLIEKENTFRARIGGFRIIYFVDFKKKEIFIFHILKRSSNTYSK